MKDKAAKRKNLIKSYLNSDEYATFLNDLSLYGMSQAEYIRWSLFNKKIIFRTKELKFEEKLFDYLRDVEGLTNNLNQITRYLHETGELDQQLKKEIGLLIQREIHLNLQISEYFSKSLTQDEHEYTVYLPSDSEVADGDSETHS
ncbi:MAG: hypothetical protein HXK91_01400 [Lachnospiraceae bacterium]|jgi:hypothetical protein|nr:hypothetical protein [Lachnospiraceae bacterium]MBF1018400.1 hypothetical protein [Lachnospiraceae bacterium]MBF1028885.1 hypothetical protein [Lachnospiraceae bacterium]